MGCGLRKLEDPDDSSPGKIFSTLKRPQVETKTEFAYEYVLLDFTLQASSNPEVIKINSILDIATKVEDYYLKGYIVGAIHPIIQPVGPRKHLPASYLYRVVLSRSKLSPKHSAASSGQRRPRLVIEECPLTYETQTNDIAKELIEKINVAAKRGMRFVGFISHHSSLSKCCNGTSHDGDIEPMLRVRHSPDENCRSWNEGTLSRQSSKSRIEEDPHHESLQCQIEQNGSPSSPKPKTGEGDHLPKSLEGFFIYEEEGSGVPGSNRKGNDAIVVEQWTIIEGCEIKTDYGPLLHTLAEFGWLLTNVMPTPILRHDSEGNLATKQVVFLQRPVIWNSAAHTPERKGSRLLKGEDRNKVSSGLDTGLPQSVEGRASLEESFLSASRECWVKEERPSFSGFSGGGGDSGLRELDDGQLDQEDGVTQVTCM
ncbi:PREDICTED: raftlin-2 isoform X2 [Dipodomys ordii]|uniref:Raftlin-2 isoform X2 n=1 Tax=Dipodomys ordii TaxID=10020 RepID=A0A1S3GFG3_DIPOR|nr:PREDICTED: raftlin-2 isoform X2 [Dipodomys ordii]